MYFCFRFWVADYNVKTESEELYSTFAYWREPICDTKSSFSFEVRIICLSGYLIFFYKFVSTYRMIVMIGSLMAKDFKT